MKHDSANSAPQFSKLRAALWPIHGYEMKKFIPMSFIMFFILFNYTTLRNIKDTLIITAPGGGAEVIPFLKGYIVLPISILFVVTYMNMANIFKRETLFYVITSFFLIFFAIFTFYLYPNQTMLHPDPVWIQGLKDTYPNFQFFFPIMGMWTYSAFYIMAELWNSVMFSLLFWQFANEITRNAEAKRFYTLFGIIANLAVIASGYIVETLSDMRAKLPPEVDSWAVSLNYMMGVSLFAGLMTIYVYYWMNRHVLTNPFYYDGADTRAAAKKDRPKFTMLQSLNYLMRSKYLWYIAILVISYGLSMGLIEIIWKSKIKEAFPHPNDYSKFMGGLFKWIGITTFTFTFLFKGVVSRFGWLTGAIATPIMLLITAVLFFSFIFFNESLEFMTIGLGFTPLVLAVYIGAIQNILSKGTKYSLFDPTKEMAYIPLDQELKVKGKAAVDVIGYRLGKGSSGYISTSLLMATAGTVSTIAPFIATIVIFVIVIWIFAVRNLNDLYNKKIMETGGNTSQKVLEKVA